MKRAIFHFLMPLIAFSMPALAATPPPQLTLETAFIKPIKPEPKITKETVKRIIPTDLKPGIDDENSIGRRILDNSAQTLSQDDYFKKSEFGKAAKGVENALKTEVTIGGSRPGSIQHKMNMQFLAFQGQAKMEYRGLLNVDMTFGSTGMKVDINEDISTTAKLNLNHTSHDNASRVQVVWTW